MAEIDEDELKKFFCGMKLDNKSIFEEFYSKYKKLVYGIAFSILKNKEDSEDITQIVFSKIYSLNTEKLPTKNYASWLYSLTKNETISYLILDQEGARLINQFSVNYQPPSGNYLEENINFNFTYQVNIVSPLADYIYLENHNDGNRIENIDGSYTISYQGDWGNNYDYENSQLSGYTYNYISSFTFKYNPDKRPNNLQEVKDMLTNIKTGYSNMLLIVFSVSLAI